MSRLNSLSFFRDNARTVNGLGSYANLFSGATTALTGARDVRFLTLLSLGHLLPRSSEGLLAPHFKWCPHCFAAMAHSGEIPYRPLAWSFLHYRCCTIHQRPLIERCPACGSIQPQIPCYPTVCHCSRCRRWLFEDPGGDSPSLDDLWIATAIEDVVTHLQQIASGGNYGNLQKVLQIAAEKNTSGMGITLGRAMGLNRTTACNWSTDPHPRFPGWLVIAYALDCMPSALLLPPSEASPREFATLREAPGILSLHRSPMRLSSDERQKVERILHGLADDAADHRSLSSIGRELGYDVSRLRHVASEQCDRITEKYLKHQRLEAERNHARIRETLYRVMNELIRRGDFPGGQALRKALLQEKLNLIPHYLKQAYREALAAWAKGEFPLRRNN